MPDIMTHYFFGLDTTNNLKNLSIYPIIKEHRQLFFVGLQGPDPIYFHGLFKKENYHQIATTLHTEKTDEFIISMFKYYNTIEKNSTAANQIIAYISGFLCHYILDATTHPYVFYLGGKYDKNCPETKKFEGLHQHIEVAIDTLILKEKYNLTPSQFKIFKHILKLDKLPDCILEMYKYSLDNTYQIQNGDIIIKEAYRDYKNYYKLTFDKFGFKKKIGALIMPLLPENLHQFTKTFSYYDCVTEDFDYLNLEKNAWLHPITGTLFICSFKDLQNKALKKITKLLTTVDDFTEDLIDFETPPWPAGLQTAPCSRTVPSGDPC